MKTINFSNIPYTKNKRKFLWYDYETDKVYFFKKIAYRYVINNNGVEILLDKKMIL